MPAWLLKTALPAAAAGLVAVGVSAAPPVAPPVGKPVPPAAVAPVKAVAPAKAVEPVLAKDPLGTLLAEGQAAYAGLRDYTCTFTRQERTNGVLRAEQVGEMKVRTRPFSVRVRFARPDAAAGQELLYVAGKRADGKVKFKDNGSRVSVGFVAVKPDDPRTGREPVTNLGVGAVLDTLAAVAAREKTMGNPVEVFAADYTFAGKDVTKYEVFTRRPHAYRAFFRAVVYVDKATKLPIRYEVYDQPGPAGGVSGELLGAYSYSDFKPNAGVGDSAFDQ